MRKIGFAVILLSGFAFGQGSTVTGNPVALNQSGGPIQSTVAISTVNPCGTSPSYANCGGQPNGTYTGTLPPASLATLYTDITLGTACSGTLQSLSGAGCSNPGYTDGKGNVIAYAAPGLYYCTYYGSNITSYSQLCIFPTTSPLTGAYSTLAVGAGAAVSPVVGQVFTSQTGTSSSYLTGQTANAPTNYMSVWEGTPTSTGTFGWYGFRFDATTKPAVNVQSGATVSIFNNVYSDNSGGTGSDNATNQVALLANSSCLGSDSTSANCVTANFITGSSWTGTGTHTVEGFQSIISGGRAAGWFSDTTHDYIVSSADVLANGTSFNGTIGHGIDSSASGKGWLGGEYVGAAINWGHAVLLGATLFPATDYWASQASSYGLFCGPGPTGTALYTTNASNVPVVANTPPNCIAAGPLAATSGTSSNVRQISTSAGGAEQDFDQHYDSSKIEHFQFAGTDEATLDYNGNLAIAGGFTFKSSGGNGIGFTATPSASRTDTFPDASITVSGAVFQDCGSTSGGTQACAGTVKPTFYVVRGDVTLNTASSQSITVLPFSASTSYSCSGSDLTNSAGIISFNTYSAASVTVQESGGGTSDHIRWQCSGF